MRSKSGVCVYLWLISGVKAHLDMSVCNRSCKRRYVYTSLTKRVCVCRSEPTAWSSVWKMSSRSNPALLHNPLFQTLPFFSSSDEHPNRSVLTALPVWHSGQLGSSTLALILQCKQNSVRNLGGDEVIAWRLKIRGLHTCTELHIDRDEYKNRNGNLMMKWEELNGPLVLMMDMKVLHSNWSNIVTETTT